MKNDEGLKMSWIRHNHSKLFCRSICTFCALIVLTPSWSLMRCVRALIVPTIEKEMLVTIIFAFIAYQCSVG